MTDDPAIRHCALALTDRHGDRASIYAAMEADERLDAGDLDRAAFWRRVVDAINDMPVSGGLHRVWRFPASHT